MCELRVLGLLTLLAGLAACGEENGDSRAAASPACPNDLPTACPSPAPTYDEVQLVLLNKCVNCHVASGEASSKPLDTYERVYALRTSALTQIYACKMPKDGTELSNDERSLLLRWFVCNAPR